MAQSPADARWSRIIERHETSGQSIQEFAAANDLNPRTLVWRRWQLRRRPARDAGAGGFVELEHEAGPGSQPREPEAEPGDGSRVVLALDGYEARFVIDERTDLSLLRRVLGALC